MEIGQRRFQRYRPFLRVAALALCGMVGISIFLWGNHPGVVRLHVIANSNSERDQAVKLEVRDALLAQYGPQLSGSAGPLSALWTVLQNREDMADTCRQVLAEAGMEEAVSIRIVNEKFPDRDYDGQKYPAGYYRAVKVVLGSGEGKNWWCVLYPPLCTGPLQEADEPVAVKSRFAQWWDALWGRGNEPQPTPNPAPTPEPEGWVFQYPQ